MKSRITICGLSVLVLMVCTAGGIRAQEKQVKKKPLTEIAQEAIEKTKMEAMQPGEQHKHLSAMVGDWTYTAKMWMEPGAPPVETSGAASNQMIFGGRFLMQELSGEFQGSMYEGLGLVGFNNLTGELQSVWIDNTATAMMIMTGTCDAEGKIFTSYGEYKDPMKGEMQKVKSVSTMVSPDEIKDEMFLITPDGETKTMELIYKRK